MVENTTDTLTRHVEELRDKLEEANTKITKLESADSRCSFHQTFSDTVAAINAKLGVDKWVERGLWFLVCVETAAIVELIRMYLTKGS